jgi:YfiH family protein
LLNHAFTTRLGGESEGPLNSFNLGRHIDDQLARDDAMKNRERLCSVLRMNSSVLAVPGQVHSSTVVALDKLAEDSGLKDVDGLITNKKALPVLLHFADCVPIILFDPDCAVVAVLHAGWRGTALSIARNGVFKLKSDFGCRPKNLKAAIGPSIGSCCYPTSPDVANRLAATISNASRLINWGCSEGQPRPDLKAINAMQLLEAGVGEVDVTDLCTACLPELFYSHRLSNGNTGRQGAIAELV